MTPYLIPHIPRHRCAHVYDICGEATDYERALRYNINEVERSSLVEMLALLKGVHAALARAQGDPEVLIRRAIHEELQHFIHEVMGPVTRKAVKYEKKGLKASLMHLRNLCADWSMGVVIMDEERMKSKEFKNAEHGNDYPPRSVPPSRAG